MRDTIKKHSDFLTAPEAPGAITALFFVHAKAAKIPNDARYGLVAAKRTFKLAVHRNRAKRLLRDWIAYADANNLLAPEFDYIFIARGAILNASRDQGRAEMSKALQHIMQKYVIKYRKSLQKNS